MTNANVFSYSHIALTAILTVIICSGIGFWRIMAPRRAVLAITTGLLAGTAVFVWRASANFPQLNSDGLANFSANDWLAPIIVYVTLSVFADLVPPKDPQRSKQVRALATLIALVVNVITI